MTILKYYFNIINNYNLHNILQRTAVLAINNMDFTIWLSIHDISAVKSYDQQISRIIKMSYYLVDCLTGCKFGIIIILI